VLSDDYTIVGDRQAHISPAVVSGFISSQTTFIPIILFLVIVFASQLIATSIASEKENKTLETLLSSPVSRRLVVTAKLVGAGLVALLTAAAYLFGMRYYITGLTGSTATAADVTTKAAITQLNLTFSAGDYVLLGLSLFFGILGALSIAIILGSFAQDTKSAQGVITPLMVLVMIPYFLTLFLDISTLSPGLKILVYAIPFSHPFLAAPNILLHQTQNVWYGIAYMAVLFLFFVYISSKIFASDKIFTMKLNFKKKRILNF
jgi:ABC-2 type transport system permease protein